MNKSQVMSRLIADEKLVKHAYQDHLGFWTIGVGRLIDERKGGGLSEKECMYLLSNNIDDCYKDLSESVFLDFDTFPDPIQTVLISMRFWLGFGGFRGFKKMIAAFKARDYREAIKEMKDSAIYRDEKTRERIDRYIKMVLG